MKRLVFLSILVLSLFVMQSLVRSIYTLWNKHDLLTKAEALLQKEKKDNQELKRQLLVVESQGFIEEEARNKLFLQKTGESRVMVDERLIKAVSSQQKEAKQVKSNWQQWWELFF